MAAIIGSLRAELSASIAQFQQDMGKAADSVKQIAGEFTRAGNDFRKIGSQMQSVGMALTKTITLPLVGLGLAVSKVGMDFEDAFAGVKKTVNGSVQDLDRISTAFREMSKTIPTSATELAKIGEIAGQMGVGKENIVEFTKTISQISTATHLTAEEAATAFGKIAAVMRVPQTQFESLGSAVYALGNYGNSTEQEMLGMAQRIAAAGATVGMTSGQVLGLANALASAGIQVESGGTAMSKLIFMMGKAANDGGKALEGFAQVAGQSAAAFKQQFQTDAAGAVVSFVEGLNRIKQSGGNLIGTIEALGIKQSRLRDATISLALAGDLVRDSVDLGTKAFSDHTAFLAAVDERYKTTSNELKILGNRIADVGITLFTALKPAIESGIALVQALIPYIDTLAKGFATLPGGVQLTVIGVLAFAAALGPAIYIGGQLVSSLSAITLAFGKGGIGTRLLVQGLELATAALGTFGIAINALTLGTVVGAVVALGFALKETASGVSNLVNAWNEGHLWETLTAKDDNTFARRWLGLSQGIDTAKESAKGAGDQFQTLKDRISGALATHDAGELTKVVTQLSNEGLLTGTVMRRVAVEVESLKAQGASLTPELENIAKAFGKVTASGGGSGFQDLTDSLKAARAEITALSSKDLKALTDAVTSGAFTMKELHDETGLSETALKLFKDQVRDNAKEMKASQSIFDEYKKKTAELNTALTEAAKFDAPVAFVKKQFGSMITDVVQDATILGKTVPKLVADAFLKITIKDATDHFIKEFDKFSEDMAAHVKADMERVNASVIRTLGVIVDAGHGTADSEAQFSIDGLKNQIKNLEAVTGETRQSIKLREQLYAEEYQYQVSLIQREAQAKKDALDKTDGYYNQALDAIDRATSTKMGLASQSYQQKIKEMQTSTRRWTDSLGEIASAFSAIAQASGGVFGEIVKEIGGIVSAFGLATRAAKDFQKASDAYDIAKANGNVAGQYAATADKVAAVAGGISAVAQATSSKNVGSAVVGGALTGAQVGSVVPGVGTAVGAGVGALVGYIRAIHKGPAEKAALDVGRDFGVNISEGLAKELGELRKTIGQQAATIFNLDKIIAEGGGLRSDNIANFTAKLRDTFVLVKQGALTAADGAAVLDKNFANFATHFLKHGDLISKELVDIVKLTRDLGAESEAVASFIADQISSKILPGLEAFTGANGDASKSIKDIKEKMAEIDTERTALLGKSLSESEQKRADALDKQWDDLNKKLKGQQGLLAATTVASQGAANALSATVAVAFSEMMKAGTPILEIADKLEPVVAQLGVQFETAGFAGGAAFDRIRGLVSLASDEIAGPALQATTGLGQALAGLSNIGQLNQETFTGLTDQISATFNNLISQGYNGEQVLSLMRQPLQTIWELASQFGFALDDSTRAMITQGLEAGALGEKFKKPQDQMIDALNKTNDILGSIAIALGAKLPAAAKTAADGLKESFSGLNPQVNVDIHYNDPGFRPTPPDVSGLPGFSAGSDGIQNFGSGTLAVLHGREGVYTDDQIAQMQRGGTSQVPATGGGEQHFHFTISALDGTRLREMVVRPGGIAELVSTAAAQGKYGLDDKFRRALRVPER